MTTEKKRRTLSELKHSFFKVVNDPLYPFVYEAKNGKYLCKASTEDFHNLPTTALLRAYANDVTTKLETSPCFPGDPLFDSNGYVYNSRCPVIRSFQFVEPEVLDEKHVILHSLAQSICDQESKLYMHSMDNGRLGLCGFHGTRWGTRVVKSDALSMRTILACKKVVNIRLEMHIDQGESFGNAQLVMEVVFDSRGRSPHCEANFEDIFTYECNKPGAKPDEKKNIKIAMEQGSFTFWWLNSGLATEVPLDLQVSLKSYGLFEDADSQILHISMRPSSQISTSPASVVWITADLRVDRLNYAITRSYGRFETMKDITKELLNSVEVCLSNVVLVLGEFEITHAWDGTRHRAYVAEWTIDETRLEDLELQCVQCEGERITCMKTIDQHFVHSLKLHVR